jgi:HEPN domain-containing protein
MLSTESTLPANWLAHGDQDLQAADILLTANGPLSIVAFLLQQAIEKYLKGYLLAQGWSLRRIHDLEILIQEAIAHDPDFMPFLAGCQQITEYYIESRYPLGVSTPLDHSTLASDLVTVQTLIHLVRQKLGLSS